MAALITAPITLPDGVTIVEVGARDGLQNEDMLLPTESKIDLVRRMVAAGASRIETASFVHPRMVPQMADAEAVMEGLGESPDGVSYIGLVLNRRGLHRALSTTCDEVNFVVGASEGFNRSNQGAAVEDTVAEIESMLPEAKAAGRFASVTISVAFGCPFDGEVPVARVVDLARRAAAAGADEVALGDTIGVATPADVVTRMDAIGEVTGSVQRRGHFHDTRNTGVANVYAALTAGVTVIDASVGGAGGCPFAPNATGNVATEDVLYTLHRMGVATGLDLDATVATGRWLGAQLGKALPSAVSRAGGFPA